MEASCYFATTNMQSPSTTIFLTPAQKAWILHLVPHYQQLYRSWYWVMLAETLYKKTSIRVSNIRLQNLIMSYSVHSSQVLIYLLASNLTTHFCTTE